MSLKSKFMYVGIRVTDLERSIDFYTRLKPRIDIYSYAERLCRTSSSFASLRVRRTGGISYFKAKLTRIFPMQEKCA